MHLKHLLAGLAVFSSLAATGEQPSRDMTHMLRSWEGILTYISTAPARHTTAATDRGAQKQGQNDGKNDENKGKNNRNNDDRNSNGKNNDVTIVQNIIKPNIIVVQEILDKINQLQRQNERELAALVQSQLALATQLQNVKDDIRINHFKAQSPQAVSSAFPCDVSLVPCADTANRT